jgi:hypothetical protein
LDARASSLPLQSKVTCPHCWRQFSPEEVLWVSQHPNLLGDVRLGAEHQQRFLPTRFTVDGDAIDSQGFACQSLACPDCHLPVPRALLELPPLFISILGAPASGKSYFLASMTWQLRQTLTQHFSIAFGDADPGANRSLNEYEELLFLNSQQDELTAIRKTELQGDLYDTVLYGDQTVSYPRPFVFSLRPLPSHRNFATMAKLSRALCLYDNAGEHFLPGQDTASSPVTRHLARSKVLLFLFDPTQDPRFRKACSDHTDDPQMLGIARTMRQETVLAEAADRVRRFGGLSQGAQHTAPLIVTVTKFDAWAPLLGIQRLDLARALRTGRGSNETALDMGRVEEVSDQVRALLARFTPEIVSAAESFSQQVVFVPVSALGCSPELDLNTGMLGVRPRNIAPMWAEVPLLYAMCRWMKGLIPYVVPKGTAGPPALRPEGSGAFPRVWGDTGS